MSLKPQSLGPDQIFFFTKKGERRITVFASVLFQRSILLTCPFGHISRFQINVGILVADFLDSCNL